MISLRSFVSWLVFARFWVSEYRIYDAESIYFLMVSSISRGLRSFLSPCVFLLAVCVCVYAGFHALFSFCNLFVCIFFIKNISPYCIRVEVGWVLGYWYPNLVSVEFLTIVLLLELLCFLGRDFILFIVLFNHWWVCSFTGILFVIMFDIFDEIYRMVVSIIQLHRVILASMLWSLDSDKMFIYD